MAEPALLPAKMCVFDPLGAKGDGFRAARDFRVEMLEAGVDIDVKPYVDERVADVTVGEVALMRGGEILAFDKKTASAAMQGTEVRIEVGLNLGEGESVAWGCDLTEQYVKINAEYTT